MSSLDRKISLLSNDECGEFRRHKNKGRAGLTLKLFNILREYPDEKALVHATKLYDGKAKMGSYRQVKLSLDEELDEFIVLRRIKMDRTGLASMVGGIITADYWIEKGAPDLAMTHLKVAAKSGKEGRHHALMEKVYEMMLTIAGDVDEDPINLVDVWKSNSAEVENDREAKLALAIIEGRVKKARLKGDTVDAKKVFHEVKEDFDLPQFDENNPLFIFTIAMIVRRAMVSSKEYTSLYEFLQERYFKLKEANAFNKSDEGIELGFMYMLAHASYRTWRFEEAEEWLLKMQPLMPVGVFQASNYYFKYIALKGLLLTIVGKNDEAVELIETTLEGRDIILDTKDILNLRINLVVNYSHAMEFRKALRSINKIEQSAKALMVNMGKEWCLKRDMIKLIIFWELADLDNAANMYRNIDKAYKEMMTHYNYKRAKPFLKCLLALINDPQAHLRPRFHRMVEKARKARQGDVEDIQAVAFFVWVRSKLVQRTYYPYLLERIKLIRVWMGLVEGEVDDSQLRV